jgi:tRNA-dihydrouridine synthase B
MTASRAHRRADRRHRRGHDGRGRRLQHRPWRADHRHQHGLPGQEGLQQVGRLGADAGRGAGPADRAAVVAACAPHNVPVTLKMRTGWCQSHRNAVALARAPRPPACRCSRCMAARASRATRASRIRHHRRGQGGGAHSGGGQWRHHHAAKAREVLATGADAVMIGRAAQGRPWIFREMAHFLATGTTWRRRWWPKSSAVLDHLQDHYALYGEFTACAARASTLAGMCVIAGWRGVSGPDERLEDCAAQWRAVADFFDGLGAVMDRMPVSR